MGPHAHKEMIPLGIFLLACAAIYLGAIEAAFSALMRLSLRLVAERSDRPGALGAYLDDPLLLFLPVRLLLGLVTAAATALLGRLLEGSHTLGLVIVFVVAFVVICELLLPLLHRKALETSGLDRSRLARCRVAT